MRGIKAHTHKDRHRFIQEFIPEIRKKLGENFIALGAGGSYARNEDKDYSDIELVAFVKKPLKKTWEVRKIIDGMLIVVVVETKDEYIKKYLDISDVWYASGADKLVPIINEPFIRELNVFRPENINEKCLRQIQKKWFPFQEITAKVFNAVKENNKEGFPIVFSQVVKELLIILSYLNAAPFITLGSYISQSRTFKVKPRRYDSLVDVFVSGTYQDFDAVMRIVEEVFSDLERILKERNMKLY